MPCLLKFHPACNGKQNFDMALLYNRISHEELRQRMLASDEKRTTVSFYEYFPINDPKAFRDTLYQQLTEMGVMGRIYVAHEGINAQVSLPTEHFEQFAAYIRSVVPSQQVNDPVTGAPQLRLNIAVDDNGKSFFVLKVKVREKIVADGIEDPSFNMQNRGKYLKADEYNTLASDPDTIIVDMRNHYEYEVGHFENAIEVPSDTFREQLPMAADMLKDKKDANIIMYCTGGIRCEKASAYMKHVGFTNVFHVEGGIIHYANMVKKQHLENKFIGKNFVFDDRLGERISPDIIAKCHQCGAPADTHVNCVNSACHLLFIQCEACAAKYEHCCSEACQEVIHLPEEEQRRRRSGQVKDHNIFNKSRKRMLDLEQKG